MRRMVGDLELNLGVGVAAIARVGGCARGCARRQGSGLLLLMFEDGGLRMADGGVGKLSGSWELRTRVGDGGGDAVVMTKGCCLRLEGLETAKLQQRSAAVLQCRSQPLEISFTVCECRAFVRTPNCRDHRVKHRCTKRQPCSPSATPCALCLSSSLAACFWHPHPRWRKFRVHRSPTGKSGSFPERWGRDVRSLARSHRPSSFMPRSLRPSSTGLRCSFFNSM